MKNSSPKTLWTVVNNMLGRGNVMDEFPLKSGDTVVSSEEKPELFARFFLGKVDGLLNKSSLPNTALPSVVNGTLEEFTVGELRKVVGTFKRKKSFGPDEVPLLVFKDSLPVLEEHVLKLFNKIASSGAVPKGWKTAKLKPIFKKGDPSK